MSLFEENPPSPTLWIPPLQLFHEGEIVIFIVAPLFFWVVSQNFSFFVVAFILPFKKGCLLSPSTINTHEQTKKTGNISLKIISGILNLSQYK